MKRSILLILFFIAASGCTDHHANRAIEVVLVYTKYCVYHTIGDLENFNRENSDGKYQQVKRTKVSSIFQNIDDEYSTIFSLIPDSRAPSCQMTISTTGDKGSHSQLFENILNTYEKEFGSHPVHLKIDIDESEFDTVVYNLFSDFKTTIRASKSISGIYENLGVGSLLPPEQYFVQIALEKK